MARHAAREATADVTAAPDDLGSSGAATGETRAQNTACPLMRLGSQVEKNGMYVTMLIALKIAR